METTKQEMLLISLIADRALKMAVKYDCPYEDKLSAVLDIEYAHKQVPMRLRELLEADDFNFSHDVFGIRRHMNRDKCKLEGSFLPRFAIPTGSVAV